MKLLEKQQRAFDLMKSGKNIFLTGPAGTGKTSVIKKFVGDFRWERKIAITSTTGISALLIGGTTLHSYTGIGLGKGSVDSMVSKILSRGYLKKRWNEMEVLIIDEISMLSPELLDKLDQIAKAVRHTLRPFGNIQLVLSGDFLQLPCIDSPDKFCNEARCWEKCIDEVVYLTEIIRQNDSTFQNCLNSIRIGKVPDDVATILKKRVGVKLDNEYGIKPTKLFPLNRAVDNLNHQELGELTTDLYEYDLEISILKPTKNKADMIDKAKKYCIAPEKLQLCVGAQVMLLWNLDLENQLANGSRGIVIDFIEDTPIVKFLNGVERIIDYHIWEIEENGVKTMKLIQIPLKLAWAVSIHKSQGSSLDLAEMDLSNVFEYGQAYVALSRVKKLEGLSITGLDIDKIKAHPKAVEFYEEIEDGKDKK